VNSYRLTKSCKSCGELKDLDQFHKSGHIPGQRHSHCIECRAKEYRESVTRLPTKKEHPLAHEHYCVECGKLHTCYLPECQTLPGFQRLCGRCSFLHGWAQAKNRRFYDDW
jgi:hypothetical protein